MNCSVLTFNDLRSMSVSNDVINQCVITTRRASLVSVK